MPIITPPPTLPGGDPTISPWSRAATTMQGVHTILAVPQWYLNIQLADLLEFGETDDGGSLEDVRLAYQPGDKLWLSGKVDELAVRVCAPNSTTQVVFTVHFGGGTMDYLDTTKNPPVTRTADISQLRLGFLVDLAKAPVADSEVAGLPAAVRDAVAGLAGSRSGAFTIERLFLDLENADLTRYDPGATVFPAGMPAGAVAALPTYLAIYLENVRQAGGHVLGYAVTVPNWTDPTPSFVPRSIDFVTNQYLDGTATPDHELDTIQYLMMTGAAPLPGNLTPWWGDYAQPGDGKGTDNAHYGTIAMAKHLFIDEYLLPVLSAQLCGYWRLSDNTKSLTLNKAPGSGTLTPTAEGGRWTVGPATANSHRTNTLSDDDMTYTYTWDVRVVFVPGTNTVRIQWTVSFDISYTHWYGVEKKALKSQFRVSYRVPVTFTVTIEGAVDGRLQVKVASQRPEQPAGTLYDLPSGWLVTGTEGTLSLVADVAHDMSIAVDSAVQMSLSPQLPDAIATAIGAHANLAPFIFPGGAQLSMVDPVFNSDGDLLMGVSAKY